MSKTLSFEQSMKIHRRGHRERRVWREVVFEGVEGIPLTLALSHDGRGDLLTLKGEWAASVPLRTN